MKGSIFLYILSANESGKSLKVRLKGKSINVRTNSNAHSSHSEIVKK